MGFLLNRLRAGFPVLRRIGRGVKRVVVGSAEAKPVDRTVEAAIGAPFLALIRKAVAAGVGVFVGWLYSRTGWDIGFLSEELTAWVVALLASAYLAWRLPNAPKAEPGR